MIVFLALVGHRAPIEEERLAWVADHEDQLVPFPGHIANRSTWASPSGWIRLFSWDNDPPFVSSSIGADRGRAVVTSGYALRDGRFTDNVGLLELVGHRLGRETARQLGGVFSLLIADDRQVTACSSRGRLESLFHASHDGVTAVANRPLTAHLAARCDDLPQVEEGFLLELLASGLAVGDRTTPFVGVHQVPEGAMLSCDRTGVRLHRHPGLERPEKPAERLRGLIGSETPRPRRVGALAEALVAAFGVLRGQDAPVKLSLTGGKDSRLIAALLHEAGIPFTTGTVGVEDHPDVLIARRVADLLGVDHRRVPLPTSREGAVELDVRGHVLSNLRACDGMQSAFERNVQRLPTTSSRGVSVGGGGGEVLRGGMARDPDVDATRALAAVRWQFLRFERYLSPDAIRARELAAAAWTERFQSARPAALLAWHHRDVRLGRWNMAGRLGNAHYGFRVDPFFDSQVIASAWRVSLAARATEHLFHSLLRQINPELADLPLADSRWRFDTPPSSGPSGPTSSGFSPRLQLSGPLGAALFDLVDEAGGIDAFDDVLDVEAVRRLREDVAAGQHDQRSGPAMFLWSLATVAQLRCRTWLRPPFEPLVVSIPRPRD